MWRYFVKMRVGEIRRALDGPTTRDDMIVRVLRSIRYDRIPKTVGIHGSSLERAWQLEFYKALYRCAPSTWVTSADVGALFGSTGFIDCTIHCGDDVWGIKLLQEGIQLDEHMDQFARGGLYQLSDYCLVDFRRVSSMDDTNTMATICGHVNRCPKLYVVCYDPQVAHVSVHHAQSTWNIY